MEKIKELRELIGVKQPELANLLEMQTSYYSAIENDNLKPKDLDRIKEHCYLFLNAINNKRQLRINEILNQPITTRKEIDLNSLSELRKALKLTQSYMANELNLAPCQYSLLENGKLTLKKAEEYHQKALQILQEKYKATF